MYSKKENCVKIALDPRELKRVIIEDKCLIANIKPLFDLVTEQLDKPE